MSDIVRGALISVPKHQKESGLAIGLNRYQLYRYILIPQAITLELPATINLVTRVIKTTSLLMLISVMDVINIGQQVIEANNQKYPTGVFWVYGLIFLLYFLIDYPLSWWANRLEKKRLENIND
jgi:ABC-type amino acid transport system, permease component